MTATRVVRERNGQWEVLEEGAKRGATREETQDRALAQARKLVRREGGGEIHVVNRAGKVVRSSEVGRTRRRIKQMRRRFSRNVRNGQ